MNLPIRIKTLKGFLRLTFLVLLTNKVTATTLSSLEQTKTVLDQLSHSQDHVCTFTHDRVNDPEQDDYLQVIEARKSFIDIKFPIQDALIWNDETVDWLDDILSEQWSRLTVSYPETDGNSLFGSDGV